MVLRVRGHRHSHSHSDKVATAAIIDCITRAAIVVVVVLLDAGRSYYRCNWLVIIIGRYE
jgi:hypothetical protein